MCQLDDLRTVTELIEIDHATHEHYSNDPNCITLKQYAGMTLTN